MPLGPPPGWYRSKKFVPQPKVDSLAREESSKGHSGSDDMIHPQDEIMMSPWTENPARECIVALNAQIEHGEITLSQITQPVSCQVDEETGSDNEDHTDIDGGDFNNW